MINLNLKELKPKKTRAHEYKATWLNVKTGSFGHRRVQRTCHLSPFILKLFFLQMTFT